jgi:DNA polymerase I
MLENTPAKEKKDTLFLVDGTGVAYRSYFAFVNNPLVNSRGEDTGAVFGFAALLLKLRRQYRPEYLALVFDTSAPTFRHHLHTQYKATREKMPEPLAGQLPRIRQLAAAMRLPVLEQEGYEADDLIGTLALAAAGRGLDVTILSGDKDFMQLVRPGIQLLVPRRGAEEYEIVGVQGVQTRFGVDPDRVVDVLGLMGDASDNVPGVPGVGAKTATRLIREWGSLEAVLASAPNIAQPKLRETLTQHADQARLSKELVTIHTQVPVALDLETMAAGDFDAPALTALFRELEFNRLLEQVQPAAPPPGPPRPPADYERVRDLARVDQLAEELRGRRAFAFDLETTSLDPLQARLVGIALAWQEGRAAYLPVGHAQGPNLGQDQVLARLGPLLADPEIRKSGQNLKYDTSVLARLGIEVRGIDFDAMIADYLLDPGGRSHNLESLARAHLEYQMQPIEELIGRGRDQITFDQVDQERACFYACEDADIAWRLAPVLLPRLREKGMEDLFARVEIPLVDVLRDLELCGVAVDVGFLKEFSTALAVNLEELKSRIHALAGQEFNLNSTQQLAQILFEKLGLKHRRKTKTGYSTDVNVLEELAQEHPLPALLLDYRELTKLKSTYVDALPALVHPLTGRIHASFNQTVTATGRLSVSDPNLQNIPIRTPLGRQIRKAFVPGGRRAFILSADYSQIELRLLAHLSGDGQLCQAFRDGEDIHARTASLLFNLLPGFVTPQLRDQAKTVNFGIIYGQTPFGLSRQLGISQGRAREFIASYFAVYSRVREWIDDTVAQARRDGYVATLLGRRRYLPEINSRNAPRREFAERTAVNTPIQGSQADMIKLAMVAIHDRLRRRRLDAAMILQVHDELVFEVGEQDLEEVEELVRTEMVRAMELAVPVVVHSGHGRNWFEAH